MDILLRAVIAIIAVYFTQLLLGILKIEARASEIILIVVVLLAVIFLIFGSAVLPIR